MTRAGILMATAAFAWPALAQNPSPAPAPAPPPPESGPIVPDSQFQKELPVLDPAIGTALEPLAPPAPAPTPTAKPQAGAPAAASALPAVNPDGSLPAPAPAPDQALSEPLTPLSSFDLGPPPAATGKQAGDDSAPEPVRYALVVEGLKEIGLEGRFRSLSALAEGDGKATNGAMVAARARQDELLAARLLRSEGYYDATALATVEQLPASPGQLQVVVATVPGPRYNFGDILVTGLPTTPPGLARDALKLKTGDPIVAAAVEAAEANVALRLPQNGYPFVAVGQRDILLDPATHVGDYTLPVDPGRRSVFAGFTTDGRRLAFDAHHVGILARFKRGELYDSRKVDDLREAMVATGLFRTVSAEPVATDGNAPDGNEYVNIRVRQEAGPARSISATAGYATGQGLQVQGTWENRNFFPPEGALIVTAIAGTQQQLLQLSLKRSDAGQRDRTLLLQAEGGRQDFPAYRGYLARLYGLVSRESTPIWQKRWTYAYGAEVVASNEGETGFPAISVANAHFIAGLIGQLGYDRSNNLLDPTRGFRLLARINPEASLRTPTKPYIRNILEGSVYYPAGTALTIAARTRIGSIAGASLSDLALSRRLYGGGGGSVRGFGYQELGPKDALGHPTGGRSQIEFALEARYRFGNYGIVPFIDAGQVYDSTTPRLTGLRYGVGIGGRIYTNFGPLRVDLATPIARQKGESRLAVYVSIGQAF